MKDEFKRASKGKNRGFFKGVYERKTLDDVVYWIIYKKNGANVKERIGTKSEGYTPKQAELIRQERIHKMRHGEELPGEKPKAPLFEDVAKKYIEWAQENKSSWQADNSRIDTHLKPAFKGKRLDEISPFDIERLKSDLIKSGLSNATVKHVLILCGMIYNKALLWELYDGSNPTHKVSVPKVQNTRERFLSVDEAKILLEELKKRSPITHDMALISLHCGLRFGEIANLKGHDIDFQNSIISIIDPKNKTPRKAFMTPSVKSVLEQRIGKPGEYLFIDSVHGGKILHISRTFFEVIKSLGINRGIEDPRQKISFHSLRHTHASWLAIGGESLITIQQSLGHKTLAMTIKYAHLGDDTRKQAALRLEQAFEDKGNGNVVTIVEK